ncbi:hypothetical protein H2198_005707 [Neophaeococcomyces mojaviensis]|uniref:Uncharacterized protein n=1 Tax=Neophaeococcomyces mojaviensis TaxID=3383035 RepID=A0ACC3A5D2_9EURO|nr:hypothetical protein H2198_005707 [Knufia sp. JES_112]
MILDTEIPFEQICSEQSLRQNFLLLQDFLGPRVESEKWARNLRFLTPVTDTEDDTTPTTPEETLATDECICPSFPTFHDHVNRDLLRVTSVNEFPDCNHYVAVSWCWDHAGTPSGAPGAPTEYVIVQGPLRRSCTLPSYVLSRAISFAAYYEVPFLWFDKECINQSDARDQEQGIQSMDIVYQRSLYPLGILQAYIDSQAQLDIMVLLIEGINIEHEQMPALLELLKIIEADRWFTRAWILQESVSGGFEMNLLIQHNPSLSRDPVLGNIEGEVETTISELMNAVFFAYACISLSEVQIDPELENQLTQILDRIVKHVPIVIDQPKGGFDNPDYRQTCNAAQALTFLGPRQNSRIADRLAIMGNLCNYSLRLNTEALEKVDLDFSICAYALALCNGDMSLTKSDNPTGSSALGYSWGPQRSLRLGSLNHFEDDDDLVRISPAKLVRSGLLVDGWLWKVDDELPKSELGSLMEHSDDIAAVIWALLKTLLNEGLVELADVIWTFTVRAFFESGLNIVHTPDSDRIPQSINEVFNQDSHELTYRNSPWVNSEQDFRIFFENHNSTRDDPRSLSSRNYQTRWKHTKWLWTYMLNYGSIPLARSVSNNLTTVHESVKADMPVSARHTAVFISTINQADLLVEETYIFQPATVLDTCLWRNQRKNEPIFWVVKPGRTIDLETNCRVIRGTGEMCYGYCRPPLSAIPERFVFA